MSTFYLLTAMFGLIVSNPQGRPGVADATQPAGKGAGQTAIVVPDPPSETPAAPPRTDSSAPTSLRTRFQMEIYEVLLSAKEIQLLDAQQLAAETKSGKGFETALKQFGETRLLFQIDQQVDLAARQKMSIESNRPFLRGTRVTKSGQITSQVEFEGAGCEVEIRGKWDAASPLRGHVTAAIKFSGRSESNIGIGNDVMAPVFYEVKQDFGGLIESGRSTALLTIDASHTDGKAVARIVRITLSRSKLE